MRYKAAIFDLDGTLMYTLGDLTAAMNLMLAEFSFPQKNREQILANINSGAREFVRRSLPEKYHDDDEFISKAYAVYCRYYSQVFTNTTTVYPGVAESVVRLKNAGIRLACFSNKQDVQTKQLVGLRFPNGEFEIALGHADSGELVFPHKPSPEGALYIAGRLGCKPSETVLIGDSDVDMKLGANAGMDVIGVSWGYRPAKLLSDM